MKQVKVIEGEDFRRMQLLELDMLVEFDRVCRAHGIAYTIFGGTLLGAVRHKGISPGMMMLILQCFVRTTRGSVLSPMRWTRPSVSSRTI